MLKYLIGPETLWLLIWALAGFLAQVNKSPSHPLDDFIENVWFYVPLLAILSFSFYWMPFSGKNYLLLRIWFVSIVMGHLVLETILNAHGKQSPGLGMAYLAGILFVPIVLTFCTLIVKIFLKIS